MLLQFADPSIEFTPVHIAFLLDDDHFDRACEHIRAAELEHWADPQRTRPGETNSEHGGRGVYLLDPAGHYLELLTRPYLRARASVGTGSVRRAQRHPARDRREDGDAGRPDLVIG